MAKNRCRKPKGRSRCFGLLPNFLQLTLCCNQLAWATLTESQSQKFYELESIKNVWIPSRARCFLGPDARFAFTKMRRQLVSPNSHVMRFFYRDSFICRLRNDLFVSFEQSANPKLTIFCFQIALLAIIRLNPFCCASILRKPLSGNPKH